MSIFSRDGSSNLYAAPLELLETLIRKFTDAFKGVFVELVVPGSSAEAAGIKSEDVIIQLCGRRIRGVLELYENMWNKLGGSVELVVIRASDEAPLHLSMVLDDDLSE